MQVAARLDEYGMGAWIAVMVLAFIVFWPIGLAILVYLIWSGRMRYWRGNGRGRWHNMEARNARHEGRHGGRHGGAGYWGGWCGGGRRAESSGNSAFDEYREETLRRLEEEQQEFFEFLDRLRQAKDKAEFDQFMAERKRRPSGPEASPEASGDPGGAPEGPAPQPA
ncbi:MAG: DUF2852 domain-containing protein [Kiloniellales bacterium]